MKIAALSLLSASDAIPARRERASSESFYEDRRGQDRRRQQPAAEAVRVTPLNRMITGLAVQIIAQIEKAETTDVAAARAAYRNKTTAAGEVVNHKA